MTTSKLIPTQSLGIDISSVQIEQLLLRHANNPAPVHNKHLGVPQCLPYRASNRNNHMAHSDTHFYPLVRSFHITAIVPERRIANSKLIADFDDDALSRDSCKLYFLSHSNISCMYKWFFNKLKASFTGWIFLKIYTFKNSFSFFTAQ